MILQTFTFTLGLLDVPRLWIMLAVTKVVVLVTSARTPRVLATKRGKVIYRRAANPCKEGTALA